MTRSSASARARGRGDAKAAPPQPGGRYALIGPDGQSYRSATPGAWGGHRRLKLYGRLDCASARRAIARGEYVQHRVFFATEADAVAAGYRPCARCCPDAYRRWKAEQATRPQRRG